MKKRLLTIILVLTFMVTLGIPAWAEDTAPTTYGFSGFITNSVTSAPIEGVTVKATPWDPSTSSWLESAASTTTTDSNGRYAFNLPEGTYRVTEETDPNWMQVSPSGDSFIVTLPGGDSSFYGIGRDTAKTLYRLNPLTGIGNVITTLGGLTVNNNVAGPNGLACDSANGLLYYTTYPGNASLYVYDLEKGTQKNLGLLSSKLSSSSETLEIACADFYDGNYYFIDGGSSGYTDDLYKVSFDSDGNISAVTKIADISGDFAAKWGFYGDIAIKDDVIYGYGKNFNAANDPYEFFKVNCDGTGFKYIKKPAYGFSLQLAFGADGVLYGYDLNGADYYAINLENGSLTSKALNCGINGFNDMASGIMYYNFENEPLYQISGYKYEELSAPGSWGYGEYTPGTDTMLAGWTMNLFRQDGDSWVNVASTTTGTDGSYTFPGLRADTYRVEEVMQNGWVQTEPFDPSYYMVNLTGADVSDIAFGNKQVHTSDETAWAATALGKTRFLSSGNWATYVTYDLSSGPQIYPLYAGQTYPVGSITVDVDGDGTYLDVSYSIGQNASYLSGYYGTWSLVCAHLAIANDPAGIPRTQNKAGVLGSPIPGKFADSNSTGSFRVAIPDNNTGSVVIAAHAELSWSGYAYIG